METLVCLQENVYAEVKWDLSPDRPCRPYLFIVAYHDVQAGTEIVLNCGSQYCQAGKLWQRNCAKPMHRILNGRRPRVSAGNCKSFYEESQCGKQKSCLNIDLNTETVFSVDA